MKVVFVSILSILASTISLLLIANFWDHFIKNTDLKNNKHNVDIEHVQERNVIQDDELFREIDKVQLDKQSIDRSVSILKEKRIDPIDFSTAIKVECGIVMDSQKTPNFLAKFVKYAEGKGVQLDVKSLLDAILKKGLSAYYDIAEQKYNLNREDAKDLLCYTAISVNKSDSAQNKSSNTVKTASGNEQIQVAPAVAQLLESKDIDPEDLQNFAKGICGKGLPLQFILNKIQQASVEYNVDLSEIGANTTPNAFVSNLASKLGISKKDVINYLCN